MEGLRDRGTEGPRDAGEGGSHRWAPESGLRDQRGRRCRPLDHSVSFQRNKSLKPCCSNTHIPDEKQLFKCLSSSPRQPPGHQQAPSPECGPESCPRPAGWSAPPGVAGNDSTLLLCTLVGFPHSRLTPDNKAKLTSTQKDGKVPAHTDPAGRRGPPGPDLPGASITRA